MSDLQPIIVYDGHEYWYVYPDDNPYKALAARPRNKEGHIVVTAEEAAAVRGWWYTDAVRKVDDMLASYEIDLEALRLTDAEIDNGATTEFVKKLNLINGHLIWVNTQLMRLEAARHAVSQALDHATVLRLAQEENDIRPRPKGSQAMRLALFISQNKVYRQAKISLIELNAKREALERLKEALDSSWRTVSRAISARLGEPTDR